MANIEKTTNSKGEVVYKVQVSGGRGRRVKRSWKPVPGWSARTIERELNKFAADLENQMASGEIVTRQEEKAQQAKAEAEAAKLKTLRQYCEGVFMPAKETTFSENARSSYQQFLDRHIYPVLGNCQMSDITPAMITKLLLDFQNSTYGNGRTYSHSSAVKLYNILCGIFKMAYLDDTVKADPMAKVSRPKSKKDEKPINETEKAYTIAELRKILQCLENEPLKWQAYVNLLADTGLRRGEAAGLQWEDIDFDTGTILVRRNLQYTPSKGVYLANPKNGKARMVDIGSNTLGLLRDLRNVQASVCISKWVFTKDSSPDPMHPDTPTQYFKKFGEKYEIADFHPHKLRHTSASLAITNGADVVSVSQRLGHSDTAVTLRMYAHANEESIRRAGQVVRNALEEKS